jgi:hypothetical protein
LEFSMPVQNMKLAMAGVLPGGVPREGTPLVPAGFITPVHRDPELWRCACRSLGHQSEEVSMADRLHENEMEREIYVSGSPLLPARTPRPVSEASLRTGEWVAYAVIVVMVCGPLAFGAFGL